MKNFQIIVSFLFIFLAYFSLYAESEVIINEIHYDVPDKTIRAEFIELHNSSSSAVDISGWRISSAVNFEIPEKFSNFVEIEKYELNRTSLHLLEKLK